jgi:nitroimidazol reductase NimA-like FMN-containing flavoprotein (pyridoxamine 5'-phosphate oxidase superfamily)
MNDPRMTHRAAEPVFRDLSSDEISNLLDDNHIGRIAFVAGRSVDIRPLQYVHDDGWLFGRTAPGEKLHALRHNMWVAFEIDDVRGPLDWLSVIARGTFYILKPEGSIHDARLYQRALDAVQSVASYAFTESDPLSFRTELFGISIDSASGRSCSFNAP